ncbi:hypothetical protein DFS34DRAFT_661981 [Phlyctochytrium arcticum]|nr:hypothetical protein DFS34DRAFT_661981 [Phlyctochytrium arcticum]
MTVPRHLHEMFLLQKRLVVMGGAKRYGGPKDDPVIFATDTLNAKTASIVPFDDWNSFDVTILGGDTFGMYVAGCARWEGTSIVVCTGGHKPRRPQLPALEITTFSLTALQDYKGASGTTIDIDIGIKSQNLSNVAHRWDHSAVILGSTYYMFGRSVGLDIQMGPGELWTLDLNTSPPIAKAITPVGTQPWPLGRAYCCMVRLNRTSFFLFGGKGLYNATYYYQEDSWIYTEGSGWTFALRVGTHPTPRNGAACTFFQGKLWAFGGENDVRSFNDMWSFDPTTLLWKQETADSTRLEDGQPRAVHFCKWSGPGLEPTFDLSSDSSLYFFNVQSGQWVPSKAQLQNIEGGGGPPQPPPPPTSSGLSGGVIGGIAAAGIVFMAGLVLLLLRRLRNSSQQSDPDIDVISVGKTPVATSPSNSPFRPDSTATLNIDPQTPTRDSGILGHNPYSQVPSHTPISQQAMYNSIPVRTYSMGIGPAEEDTRNSTSQHDNAYRPEFIKDTPTGLPPFAKEFTFVPPTRTQDRIIVNMFDTDFPPPSYNTLPTSVTVVGSSSSSALPAHPKTNNPDIPDTKCSHGDKVGIPHVGTILFQPQELVSGDEITISPGDIVQVREVYTEGWAQGVNETTHTAGFFPYNCVRLA